MFGHSNLVEVMQAIVLLCQAEAPDINVSPQKARLLCIKEYLQCVCVENSDATLTCSALDLIQKFGQCTFTRIKKNLNERS